MFTYCPSCKSSAIQFERNIVFRCPECGFTYYHSNAAATAGIITVHTSIVLLVRAKEPSKGKLAFPGGFVNPGEGAIDGLRRECIEEIAWDPGMDVHFFASFPNTYPYRGIIYKTCDLFFTISAPGLCEQDLHPDPKESTAIRLVSITALNPADLAFESARQAVQLLKRQYDDHT
jgi:ADP-ribose pyrophosphatase YjhB (NUDIX family)